jgi:hypothetical protein
LRNESGHNQETAGNGGRTGICAYQTKVDQHGQGDAVAYNGLIFVTGTKSGSTHFLANPAGVLLNGSLQAGADGVYLNTVEFDMQDGGFDCAGIGTVTNLSRTNAAGAKSVVWMGHRVQGTGTEYADVAYSATGKIKIGLDTTNMDAGILQRAVTMKANQRIYLNATSPGGGNLEAGWFANQPGGDFIVYDSTNAQITVAVNNAPVGQFQQNSFLAAPGGGARFRANTADVQAVGDFSVRNGLDGSRYFRASAAEVNCSVQLKVNNILDIYSPVTKGSASAAGLYLRIRVNGSDYYLQLFN